MLKLNCLLFPTVLLMSSMWQQAGGLSVLTRSWRVGERESGYTKQGEKVEVRGSWVRTSYTIYKHTHARTHWGL